MFLATGLRRTSGARRPITGIERLGYARGYQSGTNSRFVLVKRPEKPGLFALSVALSERVGQRGVGVPGVPPDANQQASHSGKKPLPGESI
jgi:hypothetical protein